MGKMIDRALAVLLILGAGGHTAGSFNAYGNQPMVLLWALSASILVILLGALNLLRGGRPGDRALAWICAAGLVAWMGCCVAFAAIAGTWLEPHAAIFLLLSAGLLAFSLRAALHPEGWPPAG
ncbi:MULTISPECIES: hypothetical protein [Nitrospirillum]|uniref:Uncharacterized protein n=1 Tax=Nitrospirillum amazonense TaxID=28077 RepID=A0A560F079_9PROT|nr:hypothetical protein [Nitrospirillum amazonense]MEC4593897.1 hypothetical protein [Nitrospirillum amazonense]TWB15009.1 hypothetical protein FBZ88_13243 [Nitrospirillum amazonense]